MKLWCSEPENPVKMPYDCDAHWPFEGEKSKTKQKQKMNEQTQKPKKKNQRIIETGRLIHLDVSL